VSPYCRGDAAFSQGDTEGEVIQAGHASAHVERQPAGCIKTADPFDLHVPFAFAWPQRQAGQDLLVQIKNHAHKYRYFTAILPRIFGAVTAEDLGEPT
jgi:hypothetical protein